MTENIIETRNITYYYDGAKTPSLEDVSVSIRKGVKTVILGANGAGKSTLFYHFNGVAEPAQGTVLFDGQPIRYKRKALKALRSRISVVLQNPDDQIFGQTVEADVAYGPSNVELSKEEVDARVDEALCQVGLEDIRDRNTSQLSYGQRKRLSLAGALAMKPEVLIMDEPTAGLDPQMAQELMELAEQLHHEGTTVVISTHDVDLAYAWADEIHVLRRGRLVYSGTSEGFYGDPVQVYRTGVMQPSMYLINRTMADMRGEPEAPYPRTETQLMSKMASGPKGRMRILPVRDSLTQGDIGRARGDASIVGLYGTKSRTLTRANGIPVAYDYDGFESCVSECLLGRDALLLCDETCLGLVRAKLSDLEVFGTRLEVEYLEAPSGTEVPVPSGDGDTHRRSARRRSQTGARAPSSPLTFHSRSGSCHPL